jgi:hypothetical protein
MAIIITKDGKEMKKVEKSNFEKEDYLQNYIHENPESIPVYEIAEDKKLFVVARELSTESGPIDALAIDKDGDIYVVETKLYKNPDKRTVVAQALDYGASMWKHTNDFDEFINIIDKEVQDKFKMTFQEKAKTFFEIDEEQTNLMLENMKFNLKDGNIKFVILMDSMDERLKDLIIYVNQNSRFDIYAVQLEYYKFQEYEIMIPKMFGVEVKKNVRNSSNSTRFTWDKDGVRKEIEKTADKNIKDALLDIFNFTEKHADLMELGSGKAGSFTFKFKDSRSKSEKVSVFSIFCEGNESSIQLTFGNIKKRLGEEYSKLFYEKLSSFDFLKELNREELIGGYSPAIYISGIFKDKDLLKSFEKNILEFVKEVREMQ